MEYNRNQGIPGPYGAIGGRDALSGEYPHMVNFIKNWFKLNIFIKIILI